MPTPPPPPPPQHVSQRGLAGLFSWKFSDGPLCARMHMMSPLPPPHDAGMIPPTWTWAPACAAPISLQPRTRVAPRTSSSCRYSTCATPSPPTVFCPLQGHGEAPLERWHSSAMHMRPEAICAAAAPSACAG